MCAAAHGSVGQCGDRRSVDWFRIGGGSREVNDDVASAAIGTFVERVAAHQQMRWIVWSEGEWDVRKVVEESVRNGIGQLGYVVQSAKKASASAGLKENKILQCPPRIAFFVTELA